MNWLDRKLVSLFPTYGLKRIQSKLAADQLLGYDAAKPGRTRKLRTEARSANQAVHASAISLRNQARYLDENHDLVIGIFDTLEQKVVGPHGITVEPMPLDSNGEKHEEFAKEISAFWDEFCRAPDTTGELAMPDMDRLACRSWLRDGECFGKFVEGRVANFTHNTKVPLSIELLEADFLPFNQDRKNTRFAQGIERNAWGQPQIYHFYKDHPSDVSAFKQETVAVPARQVMHLKLTKRLRQGRGVTLLHGVITRLEDLKDYEESERVAARISAVLAAYIKKPESLGLGATENGGSRTFPMAPGAVFDGLLPGEEVGTIESNRPSSLLQPFRDSMLKATGRGTRVTGSNISGSYDGTYSSQRQELVEGQAGYEVFQQMFISQWKTKIYRRVIDIGIASGLLTVPPDVDERTVRNAVYISPVMPWIDPDKESKAQERHVRSGFKTEAQVIRDMGNKPLETKLQRAKEIEKNKELDLVFSSDARHEYSESSGGDAPPTEANEP